MIEIRYKNSEKTSYQQINFEGRLFPVENIEIPIETEWNNETHLLQIISYNSYRFEVKVKESNFLILQSLKNAYFIYITTDEIQINCDIESIENENIFGEYRNVIVIIRDLSTKEYYNILKNKNVKDKLKIKTSNNIDIAQNLYLDLVQNVEANINILDDFENVINDYSVVRKVDNARLILNYNKYVDVLEGLATLSPEAGSLKSEGNTYSGFKIEQNFKASHDLYVIDLQLIINTDVNTML